MAGLADSIERRDALVERLLMNAVGAFDLFSVYLGDVSVSTGSWPNGEL